MTRKTVLKVKSEDYHTCPIVSRGEDYICESPLGGSRLVMNMHKPFMHCGTSQYVFKLRDVIMLLRAVTIVTAYQQHCPQPRHHVGSLSMAYLTKIHQLNEANCEFEKYVNRSISRAISIPLIHDVCVIKTRTHRCVQNDSETHETVLLDYTTGEAETVLLDCTTGEAGGAIQ